jgi:hypothetical protein
VIPFARTAAAGLTAVVALLLAGCGGGSHSVTPPGSTAASSGERVPQIVASPTPTPTPTPTPAPVLYVSGTDRVSAFPLTASGSTPPDRTFFVHAFQTDGITGIEAAADGTVDVLQDYRNSSAAPDCRVVKFPATANGDAAKINQLECNTNPIPGTIPAVRGRGIARGPSGEIDVLDTLSPTGGAQQGDYVQRTNFSASPPYSTGSIGPFGTVNTHHGIAEGTGGHIFISSSSAGDPIVYAGSASTAGCSATATGAATIDNYAPGASGNPPPLHTFTIVGRTAAGAVALASDNTTLYVATCDLNGLLWIDKISTSGSSGPIHPLQSIGPFGQNDVTALAVDGAGNLYAGLTATGASGNNHVRVYAANAGNGKPAPLRILQNPVPPGANHRITGLAVIGP